MEKILEAIVQNGIGVGSFICLVFFMYKYQDNNDKSIKSFIETLTKINESQVKLNENQEAIKTTLTILTEEINNIKSEIKEK